MSRSSELKKDFRNILGKWKEAVNRLEKNSDKSPLEGSVCPMSLWDGRGVFTNLANIFHFFASWQQAFSLGWTTDEVIWVDILKARNTATHVYRETYAKALYRELDSYYKAFLELQNKIAEMPK